MRKRRMTALLLLAGMLLLMFPDTEAYAGGLFGQSWFEDTGDLYIKTEGMGNVSSDGAVVEVRADIPEADGYIRDLGVDFANERFADFSHYAYEIRHQRKVQKGFALMDGICIDASCSNAGYAANIDANISDQMAEHEQFKNTVFGLADYYYPLYCAVSQIKDDLSDYNTSDLAVRPEKFTRLWRDLVPVYSEFGSASGKDYAGNIQRYLDSTLGWAGDNQAMLSNWKKMLDEGDYEGLEKYEKETLGIGTGLFNRNSWEAGSGLMYLRPFHEWFCQHFLFGNSGRNGFGNSNAEEREAWINNAKAMVSFLDRVYRQCETIYSANSGIVDNIKLESEVGLIEENLAKLLTSVAESASSLFSSNQLQIEHIIYGRVNSRNNVAVQTLTNNFSFELAQGNVYGVTGAFMFSLLRGVLFMGILIFFMYYLAKDAMTASVRARSKLKENVGYVILAIALMFAMPNLIDLMIRIRDVVLRMLGDSITDSTGITSLEAAFKQNAMHSSRLVDAAQYLGIVFVALYLGFVYIGMACSFTIMFAGFPIFLLTSFRDHKILTEWVNFCLGIIITPIIDAVLFLIPVIASNVGGSTMPNFVKLLLCLSIIPARASVKKMLGFSSSVGSEMLGVGAMMAAGRAIGSVGRTVRNTAGKVAEGTKGAIDDTRNARMYRQLADIGTDNRSAAEGALNRAGESLGKNRAVFQADAADMSSPLYNTLSNMTAEGGVDPETGMTGKEAEGILMSPMMGAAGNGRSIYNPGNADPRVAEVIRGSAGMGNVDTLQGIDDATKAKLYRNRAILRGAKTVFGAAGGIGGGVAGAAAGMGAMSFMGTNAMMMGGSAGLSFGSSAGTLAGEGAAYAGYGAGVAGVKAYEAYEDYAHRKLSGGTGAIAYAVNQQYTPDLPESFETMFGDISGPGLVQAVADAESSPDGYVNRIRSRFAAASTEDERWDLIGEAGRLGARMQYTEGGKDSFGACMVSSKLPEGSSSICNAFNEEIRKLADAKNPDGTWQNPGIRNAYEGTVYKDRAGIGHKGSEGYFGTGFMSYRYQKDGQAEEQGPAPTVEQTGFDASAHSSSEDDTVRIFAEKNGMSYEEAERIVRSMADA